MLCAAEAPRRKTTWFRSIEIIPSSVSRSVHPSPLSRDWRSFFRVASVIFTSTTWPPENPIETRTASAMSRLHDFGEDAAGGLGVQEGDPRLADPDPRLGVDQLDAGLLELRQRLVDVADRVGDVVQPGALLRQVLADRRVGAE